MPYFALIIMFYHVKIACYQTLRGHKMAGSGRVFHSLSEWNTTK